MSLMLRVTFVPASDLQRESITMQAHAGVHI